MLTGPLSTHFVTLLFLLVLAHELADYPFQGDFLAQAKNRNTDIGKVFWPHALFAHGMIHAGFVLIITGSITLALAELVIHSLTDWFKCEGKISLNVDQTIHLLCKVAWASAVFFNLVGR
jgi:hypothetical protein